MRKKAAVLFVATITLIVVLGQAAGPPRIGNKAPEFTLPDLRGKARSLTTEVKASKVTLVNFWATWCPPCRGEIPELEAFYDEYVKKGVQVLAVDLQEQKKDVQTFVASHGMSFPILLDGSGKVADKYGISGIPTTYIIDAHGVVRNIIVGGTTGSILRKRVASILNK